MDTFCLFAVMYSRSLNACVMFVHKPLQSTLVWWEKNVGQKSLFCGMFSVIFDTKLTSINHECF